MGTDQLPVTISLVGTGTTEGGGVAPTPSGTIATTPGTQPNLIINVITPVVAILVRAINLFLVTFSGVITLAGVGGDKVLPVQDVQSALAVAAWAGVSAAGVGTVKNLITVFGRLEGKYPLASGSI